MNWTKCGKPNPLHPVNSISQQQMPSKVKVTELCLTLCDPMDYKVPGILQARILEWVAFSFSRGSSQPKDQTHVSRIAGGFFTSWTKREAQQMPKTYSNYMKQSWWCLWRKNCKLNIAMYVHKLFLCGVEENFKISAYFFREARHKLYIKIYILYT